MSAQDKSEALDLLLELRHKGRLGYVEDHETKKLMQVARLLDDSFLACHRMIVGLRKKVTQLEKDHNRRNIKP